MAVNFTHEPGGEFLAVHNPIIFEFSKGDIANISIKGTEEVYQIKSNVDGKFYFDASEVLQSYFNRDFEDPNYKLEDTASVFLDASLSKKVTLTFEIEGDSDTADKSYILLQAAKELGSNPLLGQNDLLTLRISDRIPISKGTYQEIAVYSKTSQTIDNKALKEGVNRIRIQGTEDPNIIKANFNIEPIEQSVRFDGKRVKFFSRAGNWVYLRATCDYQINTEVTSLGRFDQIRGNVEQSTSNFTSIGKRGHDIFTLAFISTPLTQPYIRDMILSPKVFIEINDKWIESEITPDNYSYLKSDTQGTKELNFRLSEIDTLQLL